jgi:hypothetical protein
MNTVRKMTEKREGERRREDEKIKLLEARIDALQAALEKFVESKENEPYPADRAAAWRKRLQAIGSSWRVFTINLNQRPLSDGRYIVGRVLKSDPEHFIVCKIQESVGEKRSLSTIESWVTELEATVK